METLTIDNYIDIIHNPIVEKNDNYLMSYKNELLDELNLINKDGYTTELVKLEDIFLLKNIYENSNHIYIVQNDRIKPLDILNGNSYAYLVNNNNSFYILTNNEMKYYLNIHDIRILLYIPNNKNIVYNSVYIVLEDNTNQYTNNYDTIYLYVTYEDKENNYCYYTVYKINNQLKIIEGIYFLVDYFIDRLRKIKICYDYMEINTKNIEKNMNFNINYFDTLYISNYQQLFMKPIKNIYRVYDEKSISNRYENDIDTYLYMYNNEGVKNLINNNGTYFKNQIEKYLTLYKINSDYIYLGSILKYIYYKTFNKHKKTWRSIPLSLVYKFLYELKLV